MRAGSLDRRVTIRRALVSTNELNEELENWSDLVSVWASQMPATARELLAASEKGAEQTLVFEIRYSTVAATVTPKDRVRYQGREYDIASVNEIGRRQGLRIVATTRPDRASG